jgi:hypothetical protein
LLAEALGFARERERERGLHISQCKTKQKFRILLLIEALGFAIERETDREESGDGRFIERDRGRDRSLEDDSGDGSFIVCAEYVSRVVLAA